MAIGTTITTKEWDALSTAQLDEYKSKLRDAVFETIPMLDYMESNGRVDRVDGGELISYPLMYGRNSTVMRLTNPYDELDTTPQEGFTRAFYEWAYYSVAISISRAERNMNSGNRKKLLDLLKVYTKQARMSIRDEFHLDLITGTGANGGIHGLKHLLEGTGTVGKISHTEVNEDGELWWQPFSITSGVTATSLKDDMRTVLYELEKRNSEPDLILMAQDVHQAYAEQLEDKADWRLKTGGNPKIGFGFKGSELEFSGIPCVWDRQMADGTVYFLNTDTIGLVFHPDGEFNLGEMITPSNQHASVAHIFVMAQMVCSNRRDQAFITNVNVGA